MAAKRKKAKRKVASLKHKIEVKAVIENFTLAKAKSALKLEFYRRKEKLGEPQIGRGSLYWTGAHRQIEKRLN